MKTFEENFAQKVQLVDRFISHYWKDFNLEAYPGVPKLIEAIRYSANSGGKRFRPVLAILTAEALDETPECVLAYGASVEFIHTYSLIHDDLPCMDNDDMRRGQPTNHKVFGEDVALLAGDALLTEAFAQIAQAYASEPEMAMKLVRILSRAAGARGMVGGQVTDMLAKASSLSRPQLQTMHEMKTGALIASAVEGASVICRANAGESEGLKAYAQLLGLAFQVADDILDSTPEKLEPGSYPALLGLSETKTFLQDLTARALTHLQSFSSRADGLRWIATFNLNRTH